MHEETHVFLFCFCRYKARFLMMILGFTIFFFFILLSKKQEQKKIRIKAKIQFFYGGFFSFFPFSRKRQKSKFVHASQKMSIFFVQGNNSFFFTANNFYLNFLFVIKKIQFFDQFFFLSNIFSSKKMTPWKT